MVARQGAIRLPQGAIRLPQGAQLPAKLRDCTSCAHPRAPAHVRRGPAGRLPLAAGSGVAGPAASVLAAGAVLAGPAGVAAPDVVIRDAAGPRSVNIMCDSARTEPWGRLS